MKNYPGAEIKNKLLTFLLLFLNQNKLLTFNLSN